MNTIGDFTKKYNREYKDIEIVVKDGLSIRNIDRPTVWVLSTLSEPNKPELTKEEVVAGYKRYILSFIVKAKHHTKNIRYVNVGGDAEPYDPPLEGYLVKDEKHEMFIPEDVFNRDFSLIEEDKEKIDLSECDFTEF